MDAADRSTGELPQKPLILILCGLPGSGKTSIASSITNNATELISQSLHKQVSVTVKHICFDNVYAELLAHHKLDRGAWGPSLWHKARAMCYDQTKNEVQSSKETPKIIIVDDNMYYRSMRRPYYVLAAQSTFNLNNLISFTRFCLA